MKFGIFNIKNKQKYLTIVYKNEKYKLPHLQELQDKLITTADEIESVKDYIEVLGDYPKSEPFINVLRHYVYLRTTTNHVSGYYYWLQESDKKTTSIFREWYEASLATNTDKKHNITNIRKQQTEAPVTTEKPELRSTLETGLSDVSEFYEELLTAIRYGKDIILKQHDLWNNPDTPTPSETIYKDLSDEELWDTNSPSPHWDNPVEASKEFVSREVLMRGNYKTSYAAAYFIRFRIMTDPRFEWRFTKEDIEDAESSIKYWMRKGYSIDKQSPKVYCSFWHEVAYYHFINKRNYL